MSARVVTIVTVTVVAAYVLLRYVLIKGVPVEHVPLFLVNKVVAASSAFLMALAFIVRCRRLALGGGSERPGAIFGRDLALDGLRLALLHSVMSLALMRPAYYAKLFSADGRFTMLAEFSLLCGAIALGVAVKRRHLRSALALLVAWVHVTTLGYQSWFSADGWPKATVPLTLLSAVVMVTALVAGLWIRRYGAPRAN